MRCAARALALALPYIGALVAMGCGAAAAADLVPHPLKSGTEFTGPDLRALQADDFANPGMLWVVQGEKLWNEKRGPARRACADCHGDGARAMRGVAARYPAFDAEAGRVLDLDARIAWCAARRQLAATPGPESPDLLALSAYVTQQSRGIPVRVTLDANTRPVLEAGRALYTRRAGQMNLACRHCHSDNWGRTLLSETISQGHGTGWPAYRVEWQTLGSLQRRLRACFFGVRAELPDFGSDDLIALELFLAWRGAGLAMEAPAVRK